MQAPLPRHTASLLDVETVDYHTAGEPFRIVVGGVPDLEGPTVLDKRRWAGEHVDDVRRLLVFEPRGHADMYGCFVTEPDDDGADLGVVFFHNAGYSTACGHGTIALATWVLDSGRIQAQGPETRIVVDVPSGRVEAIASVRGDAVTAVRFRNVPSFVHARDVPVELDGAAARLDLAYGGAFYAVVPVASLGLRVRPEDLPELVVLGRRIKAAVEAAHDVVHPDEPEINGVYGVVFTEEHRNVTVFADGEVDRSPCGSGTSARLALLDLTGELRRGEVLTHTSVVGTTFRGRVVADARVGDKPAVVTEVEGRAHLTGRHRFVLADDDELGTGFLLR